MWLVLVLTLFVPVVDAAKGLLTPTEGCKVWQVTDGDTVKILCPNWNSYPARILAYDTPEVFRPRCLKELWIGLQASAYMHWMLWTARHIVVRQEDTDRYGRRLIVLLMDGEGVARRMIRAGLAREYSGGLRDNWCAT